MYETEKKTVWTVLAGISGARRWRVQCQNSKQTYLGSLSHICFTCSSRTQNNSRTSWRVIKEGHLPVTLGKEDLSIR